jgi:hypothetical protein
LSSKDKDLILGEPIPEVHDYNEDEGTLDVGTLNMRTLQEALETSVQQHVAKAIQTVEDEARTEQAEDESQDEQDPTDIQICNSPIRTSPTQVFGKNRIMIMMTTQTTTQTTPLSTNPPASTTTKAQLISTFDRTFKRTQGSGGGGGGGGGSGGGGSGRGPGGPPAAPSLLPNALVPVPAVADMRAMGNKPKNFYGDRAKADTFIEDVKAYL